MTAEGRRVKGVNEMRGDEPAGPEVKESVVPVILFTSLVLYRDGEVSQINGSSGLFNLMARTR